MFSRRKFLAVLGLTPVVAPVAAKAISEGPAFHTGGLVKGAARHVAISGDQFVTGTITARVRSLDPLPARCLGSDLERVDSHVIQPHEYEEVPELTDEWFDTAAMIVGDR
jgi:hypothetical protein